jgi:hypothetical protein
MAEYFSGPVSYYLLKPNTYGLPPVLLLGDRHESDSGKRGNGEFERCKAGDDVVYMVDTPEFIKELITFIPGDVPFPLDIYVEDYLTSGKPIITETPLSRYRQFPESKEMKENIRVRWHRTDAREYISLGRGVPNIEPEIYNSVDLAAEGKVNDDALKKRIETIEDDEVITKDIAVEVARMVVKRLADDERSNILRQMDKAILPPFETDTFLKDTLSELIMETYNERKDLGETSPDCVKQAISNWLVEIYTVLRIVKMPVAGFLSGLCLCYHGAIHTRNIVKIFEMSGMYTTERLHQVTDFLAELPSGGRCLSANGVMAHLKALTKERCEHLKKGLVDYGVKTLMYFGHNPAVVNNVFWKTLSKQKSFNVADFFRGLKRKSYLTNNVLFRVLDYILLEEEKPKEKYHCRRCSRKIHERKSSGSI